MPFSKHGYPRPLVLKSGQEVWLRPIDPAIDEDPLFSFLAGLNNDDRWYLDFDAKDPETVRSCFVHYKASELLPIVATDREGQVVGLGTLGRSHPGARGHIGRVRVVVARSFRSQRLGTYILLDLIQLAVNLGLRVLTAEFIRGIENPAIRAARRLDFFEQAVLPEFAKDPRENRYDLVIMVKRIHRGYDDF
ncbi:MAG: GNAT family N-acetyltransferase [Desulfarculaceae bacterium]|nr:GNAT family N-acetyltransferase [Desulfarculaceae bacterium]MCF8074512.1 GNAT family N-acetyltransferase [Desulfarculaceae bacterium]MCF8103576.1 GNAT family N-acetyltransferase [Desulfarculaceae bacterium]MCF8118366.1 GNAT family N-acetyltransferase [Desulfarculaceae bacterium]